MNPAHRVALRDLRWLLPLAVLLRVVYLRQLAGTPLARFLLVDEAGHDRWARSVAAGQILADAPFYQAPLYPYALGAWYAVFGTDLMAVRALQAAAGVIAVGLLYLAGCRIFGRIAGCIAAAGAALYAPFLFYEGSILKESWVVLLTTLLLLLLLRAPSGGAAAWGAAGLVLGLLSLLRENALAFLPVLLGWILLQRHETPLPARARRAGALAGGMLLALLPALLHNLAAGGSLLLTTSQAGTNFYIGNHHGARGIYEPMRLGRSSPEFEGLDARTEASRRAGRSLAAAEVSRFWFREGLGFARDHPGEYLSLQCRKLLLTWHAREIPDAWDLQFVAGLVPVLRAPLVRFGWVAPLALLGLGLAWPFRRGAGVLTLLTVTTTAAVAVFYVFARYRLPLAPLALLFAGHALAWGWGAARAGRLRPLAMALAALIPLAALVHFPLHHLGLTFTDEVGHQNLGFAYLAEADPERAAAEFSQAIAINPDLGNAWLALARLQGSAGRTTDQAQTFRRLLAHAQARRSAGVVILDPAQEAEPHLSLGFQAADSGDLDTALAHYRAAAGLLPEEAGPVVHQGILLRNLGRTAEADAAYAEALLRQPGDPVALYNRANLRADGGDREGALRMLREAAQGCPAAGPAVCDAIGGRLRALSPAPG